MDNFSVSPRAFNRSVGPLIDDLFVEKIKNAFTYMHVTTGVHLLHTHVFSHTCIFLYNICACLISCFTCIHSFTHMHVCWHTTMSLRIHFLNYKTEVHTCTHMCAHTYIHACVSAYMLTQVHAYIHACIHPYMHTYLHEHMHACMHAHTHAYAHACVCTYIHVDLLIPTSMYTSRGCYVKDALGRSGAIAL